jgi:hypothetical protein
MFSPNVQDGAEAGFHEGVVVAVGGPAHALAGLGSAEHGAIRLAGVLAAAVAVMDQARGRLPIADGVAQRVQHERLGHLFGEAPADDASRTQVEDESQIGSRPRAMQAGFLPAIQDIRSREPQPLGH